MPVQQKINPRETNNQALYHWNNTMTGGTPKEDRDYKFTVIFLTACLTLLIATWMAYKLTH